MKKMVKNQNGTMVDYAAAVMLMDDEIREALNLSLAPCSEDEFFAAYEMAHAERYGREWELSKANPIY